jgi:NAD(P)-dependent dehydrogenase (short-subunit alcohol dehydrogenase family)
MREFNGKTAFITGGASGIGLGMAKAFAGVGMNVVIADIREDRLAVAESELEDISAKFLSLQVDTTKPSDLATAAKAVGKTFGPLHVLCNNAGIGGGGKILETPEERWRHVTEINLWGPLNGIREFLPGMIEHGEEGHVVNTASFSGIEGHHHQSSYGTSKFAVVGMSEFLRNDMADTNIGVSVLCPHVVDTPIFYPDVAPGDSKAMEDKKKTMPWLEQLAVSPDTVGQQVLSAMRTGEFYIFCDGTDSREMLESRCYNMLTAMDRQFPR